MTNSNSENLDRISNIKRKVNEIGLAPLDEHGAKFEEVNQDLTDALASVEGISNPQ
ncbi:MAG: hypothetical protein ACO23Q_00550 [Candidatus Nanopelagicaceae bacterium]|jgi:hypothetical protein